MMPVTMYRAKLLHALVFFAKRTKHANLTKLFKLLYFFDFLHFKQTGYPAIGLDYVALQRGPVPKALWLELKDGMVPEDFREALAILPKSDEDDPTVKEYEFHAKIRPDLSLFTPRERGILDNLVLMFRDSTAREMSEISHLRRQPWDLTVRRDGENARIDYLLALDADAEVTPDEAQASLAEHREIVKNFSLEPTRPPSTYAPAR
jgi:uncharacterized phage-associated protein